MTKRPHEQVEDPALGAYPIVGQAPADPRERQSDEPSPPETLPEEAGRPADVEFIQSRAELDWYPDPSLAGLDYLLLGRSTPAALCVLVRCLERVLPLVAWHQELGPLTRAAHQIGVRACQSGATLVVRSAGADRERLAAALVRSLAALPTDSPLRKGGGQAVWVALYLLSVIASQAGPRNWEKYKEAGAAASAAIEAASLESLRLRDRDRFTAALKRDVDTLGRSVLLGEESPVDPGEAGPFGPLWVDEPPRVIQVANTPPQVIAAELTQLTGSPKLTPVPLPAATEKIEGSPLPDSLSALSAPETPLTPEAAVVALARLLATVRTEHAPRIDEFRRILTALAGHDFNDKTQTATVVQHLQAARTLLGVGFVLLHEDAEKNRARVSLMFDSDPSYPEGRVRAVSSATPQKKLYARTALPELDVTDISPET